MSAVPGHRIESSPEVATGHHVGGHQKVSRIKSIGEQLIFMPKAPALATALLGNYLDSLDWTQGITKHDQTHKTLLKAARLGVDEGEALKIATDAVDRHGGQVEERDISHQLKNCYEFIRGTSGTSELKKLPGGGSKTSLPKFDPDYLKKCIENRPDIDEEWLREESTQWPTTPEAYLEGLFGASACVFVADRKKCKNPLILWRKQTEVPRIDTTDGGFFVVNEISGSKHFASPDDLSSWSLRSKACLVGWGHMLVESDTVPEGDWLKYLFSTGLPIASVVRSGGKSVHTIVKTGASDEDGFIRFKHAHVRTLVQAGADPHSMAATNFTRLPFALRDGRLQELLYFCPDVESDHRNNTLNNRNINDLHGS